MDKLLTKYTMMKKLISAAFPAVTFLCVSCDPGAAVASKRPVANQPETSMKAVPGVTSTVMGSREIMRAKVNGKEVMAVLTWRPYDAAQDGSVNRWYGDMGSPPPKFVVDSLIISVDGRGAIVPRSKYGYLCSQWSNGTKNLGLVTQGENLCVYVNVGDGGEAWTAAYVVNPASGTLVSHQVHDGPAFHHQIL